MSNPWRARFAFEAIGVASVVRLRTRILCRRRHGHSREGIRNTADCDGGAANRRCNSADPGEAGRGDYTGNPSQVAGERETPCGHWRVAASSSA